MKNGVSAPRCWPRRREMEMPGRAPSPREVNQWRVSQSLAVAPWPSSSRCCSAVVAAAVRRTLSTGKSTPSPWPSSFCPCPTTMRSRLHGGKLLNTSS